MDGLAIAAAAFQFVDLASRLIKTGISIYDSIDGQRVDHHELEAVTASLLESSRDVERSFQQQHSDRPLDALEKGHEVIGIECQKVAQELLDALGRLSAHGNRSKWHTFRQALRVHWHEGKIQGLEKRLDRLRQQALVNSLDALR
jgi:hypothetical protein